MFNEATQVHLWVCNEGSAYLIFSPSMEWGIRICSRTIQIHCSSKQPAAPPVNLYVAEVWVLFVGDGTIDTIFGRPSREPTIQKLSLSIEWGIRICCLKSHSILYRGYVHKPVCKFVYRGSVGAICRTQNNRYLIFSPPGRQPAIQKVPKYGMRTLHMFYNNTNEKFIQATRRSTYVVEQCIFTTWNNRGPITSLPAPEPPIKKNR